VVFHNGDPFTAETVKFNWERITNPEQKSPQRGNHEQIAGVEIVDTHKVRVHTKSPYPIFVERLQNFQLVPEKVLKAKGDAWFAENPIGTGPYKFVAKGRTAPSPFMDVRVRHAANHAVNIESYIKNLQPGGDRAPALVNPMAFGYDPAIKPHEYDPDKAKALLAQAGYAQGFEVTFNRTNASILPNARLVFEAMQRDLEKVGIRVKFQVHEDRAFTDMVSQGKVGPMYEWSWGYYSVFDADGILWDMLHSSSPFSYYQNPELDRLLLEGRSTLDEETRKQVYSRAQQIIRDEAPAIFMWGFHQLWAAKPA